MSRKLRRRQEKMAQRKMTARNENFHGDGVEHARRTAGEFLRSGRLDLAAEAFENIRHGDPENFDATTGLAIVYATLGNLDAALPLFEKAAAIRPGDAVTHFNLGRALEDIGRPDDAIAAYRRSLEIHPNNDSCHINLGNLLKDNGETAAAAASYRRTIEINPSHPLAHTNLGNALRELGQLDEAVASHRRAIELDPYYAEAHSNLGTVLHSQGHLEGAIVSYQKAIAIKPDYAEAYNNLGITLQQLGRFDDAVANYQKAIAIKPDYADGHCNLGAAYERANRLDQAEIQIQKALDIDPDYPKASIYLSTLLRRRGKIKEAIQRLEGLPVENFDREDVSRLHFELGKLYDLELDSEQAFEHFSKGNEAQAEGARDGVVSDRNLNFVTHSARVLTSEFIDSWRKGAAQPAMESPVFLVGFPRSGTTLLDQILDGHPRIQVMEEKPALNEVKSAVWDMPGGYPSALAMLKEEDVQGLRDLYFQNVDLHLSRKPSAILVDKFPLNIIHIPLIMRLFPNCRLILALRHPCDVILSNFMQEYELNDAMANFLTMDGAVRYYERVMRLWLQCADLFPLNVHTVRYESLVTDFEGDIRKLVEFLDVGWDDSVMDYRAHAKQRKNINTPSYQQVTEPIYQRAKYRWTRYAKHLAPFIKDMTPLIEALGYSMEPLEKGAGG